MRSNHALLAAGTFVLTCGLAGNAYAHGENSDLTYETVGGQILTHDTTISLVQIFGPHFGLSQTGADRMVVNSPWFVPGPTVDDAGSFSVNFESLSVWNGSGFIDPGLESVTVEHANGTHEITTTAGGSFDLDMLDPELTWTINSNNGAADPDRGVYLIQFTLSDNDPLSTYADSRPVFFAFDFESGYTDENPNYLSENYNHHHHHMSRAYIQDNLINVPEPGSLALLGLGGLAMLRRRR
ncbi:MAG: PEP-CTERM sorting domain-containing protein [Phycisphaerales bacterium JB063]